MDAVAVARVLVGPVDESLLIPSPVPLGDWGLPSGTLAYTTGVALAGASIAGVTVSELGVAIQLYLPFVMAAAYGAPSPALPPAPLAAPGGGWLSTDLGAAGDPPLFEALLATLPAGATAAEVAAAAQEWRLPVCDYRARTIGAGAAAASWPPAVRVGAARFASSMGGVEGPLAGVSILDLTAMWAGPLATWLLQSLGAEVHKVEPECRLDGTRAIGGGGIYPGGTQRRPGRDSALWNALNHGKRRLNLDLRRAEHLADFRAKAAETDVMIDSFSPRVMPNFGIDPAGLTPLAVSMPAFPPGPERDWVAYGTGIHALLGLGEDGHGGFVAPVLAYPDPISGFTAALAVLAGLAGGWSGHTEVDLLSATIPLVPHSGPVTAGRPDGRALVDAGLEHGEFVWREVAGQPLPHPVGPYRVLPPPAAK